MSLVALVMVLSELVQLAANTGVVLVQVVVETVLELVQGAVDTADALLCWIGYCW